jgi:hypothetical protein
MKSNRKESLLAFATLLAAALMASDPAQTLAAPYDAAVLAAGPEAYWRFEDASSSDGATVADATGHHPGVYTGGATLITPPLGGNAARFDGVAQHVTADTLGTTGSALATGVTFEFLFRSTDTAQDRIFGTFNTGSNTSVTMASNSNASFGVSIGETQVFARRQGAGDLAAKFDMSVVNIYDGGWHHVVWRLDNMTIKGVGTAGTPADASVFNVTIDNKSIPLTYGATFASTPTFVDFENPFRIAEAGRAAPFADDAPAADIDEFAVYKRLLSNAEIADHYGKVVSGSLMPGDFNGDHTVNPTDFMILNNHLAAHLDQSVDFSDGDFDYDGDVDLEDFGKFKAIYPHVVSAAFGVPEPTGFVLAIGGAFLICCKRRRYACA